MRQDVFCERSEWVQLTDEEIDNAIKVGLHRWHYCAERGHEDRGGYKADDIKLSKKIHCLGAVAEAAGFKALGLPIQLVSQTFTAPDLPGCVEVRMIGDDYWGLRINPRKDKTFKRVFGVIIPRGCERKPYRLPGWFVSLEAMVPEFFMPALEKHKGLPDNYVVPQERLRTNDELRELLRQEGIPVHANNVRRNAECGTVLPPIPADTDKACVVCGDTNATWSYDFGKCWYCGKHRQLGERCS